MDVFERLNRKFGTWYESLFGGASETDLRPRDILRRILATMEDQRREGLDGLIYVPNHYILEIAVTDDDERDYLRTFLDADELAAAVSRYMEQHGYRTRGGLHFQIDETEALSADDGASRVRVRCRFDASLPERASGGSGVIAPEDVDQERRVAPAVAARDLADFADDDEPGTVPAMALGSLTLRTAEGRQEAYPLTARGLQIGRSRQAGNDIVLAGDGMVSKRHARIAKSAEGWTLQDLGSTNGSAVNGEPVENVRTLASGDEIRLGETLLMFRLTGNRGPEVAPSPVAPVSLLSARLVSSSGEAYPLASEMMVGRALTGDIVLIGEGVAARHARVTVRSDKVFVEDLNSSMGTKVNGELIPPGFPVALYEGDRVDFGGVSLRVEFGGRR